MKTLFFTLSKFLFHLLSVLLLFAVVISKSYKPLYIYIIIVLFMIYFYRVPYRKCQNSQNSQNSQNNELDITSPADGTVLGIQTDQDGTTKIAIFLSPLDVHVQYIPYDGVVINKEYKKGEFNPAYLLEKSTLNEHAILVVRTKYGDLSIKQIAGMLVRRIVTDPKIGDHVKKGDIYGMIKLSSRVDLSVPKNCKIYVKKGDKVKGCQSILAKFIV